MQSPIVTTKPELKLFAIEDLVGAPFNPTDRTERKRLKALKAAILTLGRLLYPPLVSPEGKILDGHRRVAVLKELGIREVWALVVPTALIQTFTLANSTQDGFDGRSWAEVSSKGIEPTLIPGRHGQHLQQLEQIGGQELIAMLVDNGLGAGLARTVREIASKTGLKDLDGQRRIARWLIAFGGQKRAREAMATEGTRALRLAVERHRSLYRRDGVWVVEGFEDSAMELSDASVLAAVTREQ